MKKLFALLLVGGLLSLTLGCPPATTPSVSTGPGKMAPMTSKTTTPEMKPTEKEMKPTEKEMKPTEKEAKPGKEEVKPGKEEAKPPEKKDEKK